MDSNLQITIRVNGRQAQQQLHALAQQLAQMQNVVNKRSAQMLAGGPSGFNSAQATQALKAVKAAEAAKQRAINAAWGKRLSTGMQHETKETMILTQAWGGRLHKYEENHAKMLREQKRANAQALAQQRTHQKKMSKLNPLSPLGFAKSLAGNQLVNAGKNLNWVGRQLTYNFTLPLVAAGAAAFKFSMDIERSFTQVKKVYGDIGEAQGDLDHELKLLSKTFELLSNLFGIHQEEVLDIAAAWAAAGSAGVGLANNVKATIETMILGDMDAAAATEGLIAIQAQWRFSTKENEEGVSELTTQLAYLNAIENATGISTQGLIEVVQRAGGTARTSGASLRELAALAAALVPATGDAAQAGTALRSMISSLQSPTAQAMEALKLMGITVTDPEWMGAPITKKLEKLAENFTNLSDSQQGVVSQFIATKWQVSRFDVLMRDIASGTGYYAKALDVTSDATKALDIRNRELLAVLESNPKQWDILMNVFRNSLTNVFRPMLPAIMSLVRFISELALAFSNLSPELQKWILLGLSAIALVGPLLIMLGSSMLMFGVFSQGLANMAGGIAQFIKGRLYPLVKALAIVSWAFIRMAASAVASMAAALGPIGVVIVVVIAAIAAAILLILKTDLEDKVWEIMKNIGKAFWDMAQSFADAVVGVANAVRTLIEKVLDWLNIDLAGGVAAAIKFVVDAFWFLPKELVKVFTMVFNVISTAMTGIADALSYLNPFARHSPSLVDNVRRGVSTILDEYSRLKAIPSMVFSAANALDAFSQATNAEGQNFREADLRKKANTQGASPGAQSAANSLVTNILQLERALGPLETAINDQERIVEQWADALRAADLAIDVMEKHLSELETEYDRIGNAIDAAKDKIGELANTPIEGMGALEDQIFANQHAQNLLNMELLEFEKRGLSLDSIRDKYAAMAGEIETLQGTQAELRNAGAGSDVLGWYDDQIKAIQDQKKEMGAVERQILDIQDQLDALDLEQRFLDLTKAINFDPLERQLDQIANQVTEMPFDEIVRQILEQQAIVEELTPQYEQLGAQIEREKEAIEGAKAAREGIAAQLDIEQEKLDQLKDAYSDIKNLIQDMESALGGFATAVKDAVDEASRLESLFEAGEGLDFPDQGGNAPLGREGGAADIAALNEQLQADLEKALAGIGNMDIMGDLQGAIDKLKNLDILGPIKAAWEKVVNWFKGLGRWIGDHLWAALTIGFQIVGQTGAALWILLWKGIMTFGPPVAEWVNDHIIQPLWQAMQKGWDYVVPVWNWLWENLLSPVVDFGARVGATIWGFMQSAWQIMQDAWDIIIGVFEWAWGAVGGIVKTAWSVLKTVWGGIVGVFQWAADVIGAVLGWIWTQVQNYIIPVFEAAWGVIQRVWDAIVGAFNWAWGIIRPILEWIWAQIDGVVIPIFTLFQTIVVIAFTVIISTFQLLWTHVDEIFSLIWTVISTVFTEIWHLITEVVIPIFEWLWQHAGDLFSLLGGIISSVWTGVIRPVFETIWSFITNILIPIFEWLWQHAGDVFALLGGIISSVWTEVISPVFSTIWDIITNTVIPIFEWLWERAGEVFNLLGGIIQTVWNDIIEPVFNTVQSIIETVVIPAFETLWGEIDRIWNGIATTMQTVWDTLIQPIWDAFQTAFDEIIQPAFETLRDDIVEPIMNEIASIISTVWNGIAGVIESSINLFVDAFNLIGSGVNAVANFLHIDEKYRVAEMSHLDLPELAAGGVPPTGGAFNSPRAIVGEGSKIYPEYVIPTDPRYRNRALGFWQQAGARLMETGGVVPDIISGNMMDAVANWSPPGDFVPGGGVGQGGGGSSSGSWGSGGGSWIERAMAAVARAGGAVVRGAVKALWTPLKFGMEQAVKLVPNEVIRSAGSGVLNAVDRWVSGRDAEWDKFAPAAPSGSDPLGTGPTGSGATAAGIPITHGPGSWKAFTTLLNRMKIPYTNLGTYGDRPTASGARSMHQLDRAMDFGGTQSQLQAIDHALYDAFKEHLHELIWKGPDMRNVYLGKDHLFRPEILNPHAGHVHASMAAGGRFYVPRIPGGVNLNVSEGRSGEQVQILPVDDRATGGTTIVINGNLEFPSVRNGTDAKDFLDNLKALAN